MFGLFKKLNQIIGNTPEQKKHLGQYSHQSSFQDSYVFENYLETSELLRINTDIYLNAFATNSFTISIENRKTMQEFHLVGKPYSSNGFEVFPVMNSKKVEFIIAVKRNEAFLKIKGLYIGERFLNV